MPEEPVPSAKPDYPPLLGGGLHPMSISQIRALCVDRFPDSTTRPKIMAGLVEVIHKIQGHLDGCEMWINGSFLTEKIDPEDVDFVLRIKSELYDYGTFEKRQLIDWVASNLRNELRCDSYIFFEYAVSDPQFSFGDEMRQYWLRQFGTARNQQLKGIASYTIGS